MGRKLFCQISPATYRLSVEKGIALRKLKDAFGRERIAKAHTAETLPNVVKSHSSVLIRRLEGVDLRLQENKVTNLTLACRNLNGLTVKPGETFSFWRAVGRPSKANGYKEGLVIGRGELRSDYGGGLCQLANMVHWMVLNSPLTVTELHHHTDALFPDERRRVPFGTGTSVMYNYVDYRFRNTTDQAVGVVVWLENGELCGELRSERPFPFRYKLVEEDHHFQKEGDDYYRVSKVYRIVIDREENRELRKELILDNHSKVLYDHALIPPEQIRPADGS